MAPTKPRSISQSNAVNKILFYATNLQQILSSKDRTSSLATDLYQHIDMISEYRATNITNFKDLDEQGTKLWNCSTKLKRTESTSAQLVCLVRVFACLLLDCAQRSTHGSIQNSFRVLKLALRTTRFCIDQGHIALAERVLERAAHYQQTLKTVNATGSIKGSALYRRLSGEYLSLRVALAWRQTRLDLAENWLAKIESESTNLSSLANENLADLLYEIGKDQHSKGCHVDAVRWLEKAEDVLTSQPLETLSSDGRELEIAILHLLARALLELPAVEAREKVRNIVSDLSTKYSDRLVILLLRLDLFAMEPNVPHEDYRDVLLRIVRTIHVTESALKTILHYIHILRTRSSHLAHDVLKSLLLERLSSTEQPEWVEKVLVTLIWNCTTSSNSADHITLLQHLFHSLKVQSSISIGLSATHAAQVLFWKCIETSYLQGQYENAEAWCRLALEKVLDQSGGLNTGKLQRKLILCLLATADYTGASEVHSSMSESTQESLETRYLMYKVGLRSRNDSLAYDCLDSIYVGSANDPTLLYACVLEAQQTGQRGQVVAAMQRVLDRHSCSSLTGVHLPALLRCTARLLMQDIEDTGAGTSSSAVDAICKVFEGAAVKAKTLSQTHAIKAFSLDELDWFSRNSYNIALKKCTEWRPDQTLCLLKSCLEFIDQYPSDADANSHADQSLRRMFCDFLCGSLLIMMAREEDRIGEQLQKYEDARKHAKSFRNHLQDQMSRLEGGARDDLIRKTATFLAFDFEAATQLKAWEDIEQILEESQIYNITTILGTLADIILSSEAPTERMISTLHVIVNVSWRSGGADIVRLARWIRCLFQLALTSKIEAAEHLLDQVLAVAKDSEMTQNYPPEELEWLATTTFNRSIDFYCASQDSDCRRWAEKALSIAHLAKDAGALHELLQSKYVDLRWHD